MDLRRKIIGATPRFLVDVLFSLAGEQLKTKLVTVLHSH